MRQGVKRNIKDNKSYYISMTVVRWIDIFSRKSQRDIFINSLKFCIANEDLKVYAYCIMSNHVHLIVNSNEPFQLSDTIRDLKKFTSKAMITEIIDGKESRREWLLQLFRQEGLQDCKNKNYKVWQTGNHAIELYGEKFTWVKINYIHYNPVKAGLVDQPDHWSYSSASNYQDKEKVVLEEVICISPRLQAL